MIFYYTLKEVIKIRLDKNIYGYYEYLKQDFSDSFFLANYKSLGLDNTISNTFKTLELVYLYNDHEGVNSDIKELLDKLYVDILRFTYILPLGDNFFYNAIVRSISESILRLYILMFDDNKTYSEIKLCGYKNLKKFLNESPKSKDEKYSQLLMNFKGYFGTGSKTLHGSMVSNSIDFLHSVQRELLCQDSDKMMEFTHNLLCVFRDSLPTILCFDKTSYTTSQLSVINYVSKK